MKNKNSALKKSQIFKKNDLDTGNTAVQIVYMTEKINEINEHLKNNPKDNSAKRGVTILVGKRRRLCEYYKKNYVELYPKLLEITNLRK